jgi:exonuclease SbcD
MTIQLIHVSDIHFGSGEGHGRLNPESGLNSRFEDFVSALMKTVDYAIDKQVDVFLFSGDAYRNASPEPIYQKMFAGQLKRLSDAGITTILLVGNHDQILRSSGSHAMSVFQSLAVPGVITIDQPFCRRIETANGPFQLIGIPHVTRHQLMTSDKYASMNAASLDRTLVDHVESLLKGYYDSLDPAIPSVVTAHMTLDRALAGIEKELLIGYTLTFPADIFIDERLDYVALGHVHKHQAIRAASPAIVYAGSLERVDFGEEDEDKGFIHVELERGNTRWHFQSIDPRPFVTVDMDLTRRKDKDSSTALCEAIERKILPGCVLRVRYKIAYDQAAAIDENRLRSSCSPASSVRFQPEVVPAKNRARLPQLNEATAYKPLDALEIYLNATAPDRKEKLLERARQLIEEAKLSD